MKAFHIRRALGEVPERSPFCGGRSVQPRFIWNTTICETGMLGGHVVRPHENPIIDRSGACCARDRQHIGDLEQRL